MAFPYVLTDVFRLPAKPSAHMIATAIDYHKSALVRIAEENAVPQSVRALGDWIYEHRSYTPEAYEAMREEEARERMDKMIRDEVDRTVTEKDDASSDSQEDEKVATPEYEVEEVEPRFGLRSIPGNYEISGRMPELEPIEESSSEEEEKEFSADETRFIINTTVIPPGTRSYTRIAPPYEHGIAANWQFHRTNPNSKDGGAAYSTGYWEKKH